MLLEAKICAFKEPLFNFLAFLFLIKFRWMPGGGDGKLIIKRPRPDAYQNDTGMN